MTDRPGKTPDGKSRPSIFSVPLGAILVGIMLLFASLLPWGDFAKDALWSEADSRTYAEISAEYHRISYQTPQRAGVSEEQLNAQIEKAKMQFEVLKAKLQSAQQRPLAWRRYLLWAGVLLITGGCLGHYASDRK